MSTAAVAICPTCDQGSPLQKVADAGDTCPHCGATFPDDAPVKVPREEVDAGGWDEVLDTDDYTPMGGVDVDADEVSEPARDVEAITSVLAEAETGDVLHLTIGAQEFEGTENFYVINHERGRFGFDHRVSFVQRPEDDGWTRLHITGIGADGIDPWEVMSAPYDLGGDKTLDIRDRAAHGWIIDAEQRGSQDE